MHDPRRHFPIGNVVNKNFRPASDGIGLVYFVIQQLCHCQLVALNAQLSNHGASSHVMTNALAYGFPRRATVATSAEMINSPTVRAVSGQPSRRLFTAVRRGGLIGCGLYTLSDDVDDIGQRPQ